VVERRRDQFPEGDAQIGASIRGPFSDRYGDGHAEWDEERAAVLPLIRDAQNGSREAFGHIYRRYHRRVYGLARFYLGAGAEDAVAETFTRAWTSLPRYKSTGAPFVAWLYGIARHVVADELRSRKRTEAREQLPDTSVTPDHDDRIALASSIARLPKQQRQVIEMKYLLGMSNPEVAVALRKSIGAVNAQQWRALQALKEMMNSNE
jgi:RNA polymerase sigma-70 factor, ECF subfamily